MSDLRKLLGRRVQEIRKTKGLKQEQLAELIEIAPRNLCNIETGRCFPSPENLEKLSKALQCNIKDLFDFEHHKETPDLSFEIERLTKSADRKKLQDLYKITKALIG